MPHYTTIVCLRSLLAHADQHEPKAEAVRDEDARGESDQLTPSRRAIHYRPMAGAIDVPEFTWAAYFVYLSISIVFGAASDLARRPAGLLHPALHARACNRGPQGRLLRRVSSFSSGKRAPTSRHTTRPSQLHRG